jgi:hypothetical protein
MPDGNLFGFSMHYGRGEFITDFNTIPTDKDTPINPGETHVFRIPIETATGWERCQEDQKLKPPKKVEVMFDHPIGLVIGPKLRMFTAIKLAAGLGMLR